MDRRILFEEQLLPTFLLNYKGFSILAKALANEFANLGDYTEIFPTITQISSTPETFIPYVGDFVGYDFKEEVDANIQREIIKRIFEKYRSRGSEYGLTMMASHGANIGYVGGSLFIPKYYTEATKSKIRFPRDYILEFDNFKSKRSGKAKYPDAKQIVDGVLEIIVGFLNEEIRRRVESEMKPAGVKLRYVLDYALSGSDSDKPWHSIPPIGITQIQVLKILNIIDTIKKTKATYSGNFGYGNKSLVYSGKVGGRYLNDTTLNIGREVIAHRLKLHPEFTITSHYYDLDKLYDYDDLYLEPPAKISTYYRGFLIFDSKWSKHSGRYGRSGSKSDGLITYIPYRRPIDFRDKHSTMLSAKSSFIDGRERYQIHASSVKKSFKSASEYDKKSSAYSGRGVRSGSKSGKILAFIPYKKPVNITLQNVFVKDLNETLLDGRNRYLATGVFVLKIPIACGLYSDGKMKFSGKYGRSGNYKFNI